jgi:hypothetical protein
VIVANPSGDPENVSLAFDKPAETDTLHASANEESTSQGRVVGRTHGKLSAEVRSQNARSNSDRSACAFLLYFFILASNS